MDQKWTTEQWQEAIEDGELDIVLRSQSKLPSALKEQFGLPFVLQFEVNQSGHVMQGRSLAEVLRNLADFADTNTKADELTPEEHQWRDNRNLKDTWTLEKWQDAIARQKITISLYEPFELPFALRLARDCPNTSQCTAQGRSLAEALRNLADWVEMNTKESDR